MKDSSQQLKDLLQEYCFYKAESDQEQLNLKDRLKKDPNYPLKGASQFLADFLAEKANSALNAAIKLTEDMDIELLLRRARHNYRAYDLINHKLTQKLEVGEVYHNEYLEELLQKLYTDYGYLNIIKGGIEVAKATDIQKFGIECEKFNSPSPESNLKGQLITQHL